MAVHHQPQTKFKNSLQFEVESKKYRFLRILLLFLLLVSAVCSVSRLAISSPPPPMVETFKDAYSASSRRNHLLLHQEKNIAVSITCSEHIDGLSSSDRTNQGLLCCDRSHKRTDICYTKGDIRTNSKSHSILLHSTKDSNTKPEKIRPYTRKWETSIMSTIDEITLQYTNNINTTNKCDVHHSVPAIVFSTGGYTGNVYHEFNDGLIPLYITAERFKGEVVFVVLEYHSWWKTKYISVVNKLTKYKMIDFSNDPRVHCFPEMIVGLKIHGELAIDSELMHSGKTIHDFQKLLDQGFGTPLVQNPIAKPKLAIFVRNKSRVIQNLKEIIKLCERIGFQVQILNPRRTTPLSEIYAALNSSDAMMAVHGAAMTHFLFMGQGKTVVQIVPLGLDWAAEEYYGVPARRLGLRYVGYKINPTESSLYRKYDRRNPVIRNPDAITSKGWSETKKIYLESQNVRLNLKKFSKVIAKVHSDIVRSS